MDWQVISYFVLAKSSYVHVDAGLTTETTPLNFKVFKPLMGAMTCEAIVLQGFSNIT